MIHGADRSVVFDMGRRQQCDLFARVDVLDFVRRHLAVLTGVGHRRLRDQKIITDFLVAAHSVPTSREGVDPVVWLASEWRDSLRTTRAYRCSDERPPSRELNDALFEIQQDLDSLVESRSSVRSLSILPADADAPTAARDLGEGGGGTVARRERVPLEGLFDAIRRRAAELYHGVIHLPQLVVKHITISPAAKTVHDPYSFTASTHLGVNDRSRVVLHVHLAGFGPESYAALARALVHECVAHVWAGHPRSDNDLKSIFAEGWMDFAAEYHFKRWMPEIDEQFAHAALHHGRLLSELMPIRGIEGRARIEGHISASKLSAWFEARGLADHGDRVVAHLARDLNSLNEPLVLKNLVAAKVLDGMDVRTERALHEWVRCAHEGSASERQARAEAVLKAVSSTG